ncbi:TM2 domain [Carpediemonas membranifera]|uniref:TM2 domain n=1 Tax=Carpediemonas membranifera TaxID=201153 RepID=A0A8J6E1A9_9EUKA|nr:TM2 domain [Carpediemonas membranifera]|eukprot:KAG9392831.1 TM2 domain [Carpediemonas membranifera]
MRLACFIVAISLLIGCINAFLVSEEHFNFTYSVTSIEPEKTTKVQRTVRPDETIIYRFLLGKSFTANLTVLEGTGWVVAAIIDQNEYDEWKDGQCVLADPKITGNSCVVSSRQVFGPTDSIDIPRSTDGWAPHDPALQYLVVSNNGLGTVTLNGTLHYELGVPMLVYRVARRMEAVIEFLAIDSELNAAEVVTVAITVAVLLLIVMPLLLLVFVAFLASVLGCIYLHRFYIGHRVVGVLYLFTAGFLFVGVLADVVLLWWYLHRMQPPVDRKKLTEVLLLSGGSDNHNQYNFLVGGSIYG